MTTKDTSEPRIYASMDDLASGLEEEFTTIDGYKPNEKFRIGSLTAGDLIEWSEANEGEAKKTAGLRLICRSLVGPTPGNVRYANDDKNIAKFRAMRHKETERIVRDIVRFNGMKVKGDDEAKKD